MIERQFAGWHKPKGAQKYHYFDLRRTLCRNRSIQYHPEEGYLFNVPTAWGGVPCSRCLTALKR